MATHVIYRRILYSDKPGTVCAVTREMFFDLLAVHINDEKAGHAKAVFNIDLGSESGK
ncbi:hypothetical protein MUU47_11760 [Scandinavium sp. H11S7]|uniref:Uncharacterized protein n=1 Tax=Scandinavium hiltneri TaxID=2926519 RepID=A0ABT2E1M0_9ENTR|nr:hypothetical protein [Scandinavium hiltneri]MCS2161782.1 hypothetical protein [Scandinavium hiltneri]